MRSAEMYRVDITADLNDEDHTGYIWTFLDEARDPAQIRPGAIVIAGDESSEAPAILRVTQVTDRPIDNWVPDEVGLGRWPRSSWGRRRCARGLRA